MKNLIFKAFINFSFWTALSRIFGFVRDVLIAASLGAGPLSDAFFVAFKLPNMFRRLVAEGALVQSFLPTFTHIEKTQSKHQSEEFASNVQSIILFYILIFIILAEIFMSYIIFGLAPGFIKNTEAFETAVFFARATIVYLPMLSLIAIWGSVLQSSGKFMPSAATPIILNISLIISSILILTLKKSDFIIALSVPLAGIMQLIFLFYCLKKQNIFLKIVIPKKTFDYRGLWKKFLPAAFGAGVLQVNLLVDTILASIVGASSISYLYYADRLSQLPLGIIGVALGTALLPNLSKAETRNEIIFIRESIEKSLVVGLMFSIPACFAFLAIPEILIEGIYARGAFEKTDIYNVSIALSAYGLGIPAFISIKIFQSSFFAMHDTLTPFRISIFSVTINIVLSILLMQKLGFYGIALATSVASYLTLICYFILLNSKQRVSSNIMKPLIILLFLGFCFYFILFELLSIFGNLNLILSLILIIFISMIIWFSAMIVFRFIKINSIKNIFIIR